MNRGIYPILSGALVQEQRLHTIAHNTANVNTTGFKREEALFGSLLARAGVAAEQLRPAESPLGHASRARASAVPYVFAQVRGFQTDFSTGRLRETQEPLHLAIQGEGFFEVKTPDGLRHTRNGRFHLDANNRLVTEQGYPVMGTKGELKLPGGTVSVGHDGSLDVENKRIGTVKVVAFEDTTQLVKAGQGFFAGGAPVPLDDPAIESGHLEESNVHMMEEMVKLIEVSRVYESAQKVLQTFDHLAEVAIRDIGSSA